MNKDVIGVSTNGTLQYQHINDVLEYNGMTWINIDRFKEFQDQLSKYEKDNNDLRLLYRKTYKKLYESGKDYLANYFMAQINDCPTFTVETIDYYERCKVLESELSKKEKIIDGLENENKELALELSVHRQSILEETNK